MKLLLKIRDYLIEKNAWNEENRIILENRISDYVYFALFHGRLDRFEERFNNAVSLWASTSKRFESPKKFKKMVLTAAQKNDIKKAKLLVSVYRCLRKMVRGNG